MATGRPLANISSTHNSSPFAGSMAGTLSARGVCATATDVIADSISPGLHDCDSPRQARPWDRRRQPTATQPWARARAPLLATKWCLAPRN
jgi:hypothetical protein